MFERFTEAARYAVVGAQTYAREFRHSEIGAEHVLLGLLDDGQGVAARVLHGLGVEDQAVRDQVASFGSPDSEALKSIGIDLDEVRRQAEKTFGPGALDRPRRQREGLFGHRFAGEHLPFTREAKSALQLSLREAAARKDSYIGSEHLLLGLLTTEQHSAPGILSRLGVTADPDDVRSRIADELRRSA